MDQACEFARNAQQLLVMSTFRLGETCSLIVVSHNMVLVIASIAVSLVAAFTGLAISNNIASLTEARRKTLVVMSAFVIGGGIWSMHFVAMLAHEISVPVYYDSLQTLGSALIAILVVGAALLLLHFSKRTPLVLTVSGLVLGAGVIVMHYVGMLAIRGVIPRFSSFSVLMAMLVAAIAGIVAVRVAYGNRSRQNIVFGSVVFGFAVAAVHYAAMFGTSFQADESFQSVPVAMSNNALAISVAMASFVICGAFLLATTSFLTQSSSVQSAPQSLSPVTQSIAHALTAEQSVTDQSHIAANADPTDLNVVAEDATSDIAPALKIPFEKNKKIGFLDATEVAAVRADGHYTKLYSKTGVHFCPWSITEAESKLAEHGYHRTHRSYLVNIKAVDNFEKRKDTGVCIFRDYPNLSSVPVSRNRVISLLQVLDDRPGQPAEQSKEQTA